MIFCEAIPNTTEAILVIVKSGGVYLDGSFPVDSIPEELIIFLTQQNNFEIYIHGDVPISQTPEEGKFSFETSSVKSFTVLEEPIFQTLPLLKMYQLQLVDPVLKAHGIGVFPVKQLLIGILGLVVIWFLWSYFATEKTIVQQFVRSNPYESFYTAMVSPKPDQEMKSFLELLEQMYSVPGWSPASVLYSKRNFSALMQSAGSKTEVLFDWAQQNHIASSIKSDGIYLSEDVNLPNRPIPSKIYPMKEVLATFVDRLANVYPGNNLTIGHFVKKEGGVYTSATLTIKIQNISPVVLAMIGEQFKDLPFVLHEVKLNITDGNLTGSVIIEALGS